jgi:HJR/Mrr/RecB family endonuclease
VHTDKAFAVQVKRRESPEAKEGASLVREFLGACVLSGHRNAKIVTTAGDYTEGAKVTAQKAIQCLAVDSYDLIARDRFIELFRYTSLAYKYPWTEIAKYWKDTWYNTKAKFWTQDSYLK